MKKIKVRARKLRMTRDGAYEIGTGVYYGSGMPLYEVTVTAPYNTSHGVIGEFLHMQRAYDRQDAIDKVLAYLRLTRRIPSGYEYQTAEEQRRSK